MGPGSYTNTDPDRMHNVSSGRKKLARPLPRLGRGLLGAPTC